MRTDSLTTPMAVGLDHTGSYGEPLVIHRDEHYHTPAELAQGMARVPLWIYVVRVGMVLALAASLYAAHAFRERAEFAESQATWLVQERDAARAGK